MKNNKHKNNTDKDCIKCKFLEIVCGGGNCLNIKVCKNHKYYFENNNI